jgi:polyphenol oxidase
LGDSVQPSLTRVASASPEPVVAWVDETLRRDRGIVVAFSERSGGASAAPFTSLNLAAHVGDDPAAVDANRTRFAAALGMGALRDRLTFAEQVHGAATTVIDSALAGAGAYAQGGPVAIAQCDALITFEPDVPLVLCFADCVPVVLVAPGPAVAVVHAGWRGALASLPGAVAERLAVEAGCGCSDLLAYVGPHIGACHYQTSAEILSQFTNAFGTLARAASGGLDLDAAVTASLERAGVAPCSIARLGACTAETTDRFYSYRAEGGSTGRHAALVCIPS